MSLEYDKLSRENWVEELGRIAAEAYAVRDPESMRGLATRLDSMARFLFGQQFLDRTSAAPRRGEFASLFQVLDREHYKCDHEGECADVAAARFAEIIAAARPARPNVGNPTSDHCLKCDKTPYWACLCAVPDATGVPV